jgi:hypothetical protein
MLEKEREALITETKRAFANVVWPKRIDWGSQDPIFLGDKKWNELSADDVLSNFYFFLFSAEGFHYYFPGYVITMLQNPDAVKGGFLIENMLRQLSQSYPSSSIDLCRVFNKKQRRVVIRFLDLFGALWLTDENNEDVHWRHQSKEDIWIVRKFEKQHHELLELLAKAKAYWQECE